MLFDANTENFYLNNNKLDLNTMQWVSIQTPPKGLI